MNHRSPILRRSAALGGVLAVVWLVAAAIRPTSTYHLAPILITLAVPYLSAGSLRNGSVWNASVAVAAVLSLTTTTILTIAGWLEGPSLLPFGGAATEAVVFTSGAALVGFVVGLGSRINAASGARQR